MEITLISDLHGNKPELPGGDLLIIAGDLTSRDTIEEHEEFCKWASKVPYTKIVIIAGNHDNNISADMIESTTRCYYMEDSYSSFEGLKIWGSPWTLQFKGQNPDCMAFSYPLQIQMEEKWEEIPDDVDILVTHTPPFGIMDQAYAWYRKVRTGCPSLLKKVKEIKPKLHVFGHIHEHGGKTKEYDGTIFVNAAHVNEYYEPINKPVIITL